MSSVRSGGIWLDYLMIAAVAVIYGGIFSLNKLVAQSGVPALAYAFWQSVGAAFLMLILLAIRGERLGLSPKHLRSYAVIGGLAAGIPVAMITFAAPNLPAAAVSLMTALSPPFTFAISVLVGIERFRWLGLIGLMFGFAGVLVLVAPGAAFGAGGAWRWYAVGVSAIALFASSNVAGAVLRPPAASSVAMAAGVMLGSSAVLLPILLAAGQWWVPQSFDIGAIGTLIAALAEAIVIGLFFEIVRRAGPVFFAQFNYLAVLAGVAWAAAIFGERLSLTLLLAMALMFLGMFLASRKRAAA